jgi:hypothetical protein
MAEKDNSKNIDKENKSLKEQIDLLKKRLELQEESFDVSTSAVDSLKEILGIQSRSSTFEKSTLKVNQDIANAIINQKTGLSDITTIQRQIQKNEDLIKKSKLIEKSLLSSIGGELSKNGKIIEGRIKKQSDQNKQLEEYNKRIEAGQSIDLASYNQLKQKIALNEDLISQEFSKLSSLEQQYVLTQQNTKALEKQQKGRQAEKGIQKELKTQLGFSGKIAKALGAIPGIGDASRDALAEVNEELNQMVEESGKLPSRWKTFSMLVGKTTKSLDKGLTDPVTIITGLISLMKDLDGGAENYARSMNVTYEEALKVRNEMEAVSGVTKGQMLEASIAVNQQLGTSANLTQENAAAFAKLQVYAGMTADELMGITSLSLTNGKNLKQNTNEFMAQAKQLSASKKIVLNEKQLMADISKISAATTLSLGKNPKALGEAAATAKALGMEMSKLEDIAGGLLDFESSIENELSAELLTGKDLNLEKARQLALNNDIAGMAEEINNQIGTSADYTKMNRIQQEALAKSVGMNREELAQTLYTQEQLKGLTGKEAEERQALLDQRIEEVGLAQAQREIEEGGFAALEKQGGIQTQFNQQIEELKKLLAEGILPVFKTIAGFIHDHMNMVKVIAALYLGMKVTLGALNALNMIGLAIDRKRKKTSEKEAAIGVIGSAAKIGGSFGPLGIAIAAGIVATGLASLAMFSGDDIMSPGGSGGGYGQRTLFGPEGAIQLNNKDTVIAGTNLFGDDVKSEPGKATEMAGKGSIKVQGGGGNDTAAIISAINALANRPINVSIDGKKVIEATTGANPNTAGDENRKNSYKMS